MSRKNLIFYTASLLVVVLVFVFFKQTSQGQSLSGLVPFGGKVVYTTYCPCSQNFFLVIAGPAGGAFMYEPGPPSFQPQLYQSYNLGFQTGMWALGLYRPGGHGCWVFNPGSGCAQVAVFEGTLTSTVGTSVAF